MLNNQQKDFKTLVTGGSGMIGSAIKSLYPCATYLSSKDVDLRDYEATLKVFEKYQPHYVIHLAAKVGGVKGNSDYMADFFTENSWINTNVLHAAHIYGAKRVVSMLSTCVYPAAAHVTYPLTEDQLHAGPPHESNFGYAYAKRMLEVQSRANQLQHGTTSFICAIPNNIYGIADNFDIENGHVIPALIRKIWEAKHERKSVVLWGPGSPLREFTHASDIARAILFLLWTADTGDDTMFNIGNTKEISIKDVAKKVAEKLDFQGSIIWNTDMPSGQFRKPSSNAKFLKLGFSSDSYVDIDAGLRETCDWFKNTYPFVRGVVKGAKV